MIEELEKDLEGNDSFSLQILSRDFPRGAEKD
jgi:hypothetical protein